MDVARRIVIRVSEAIPSCTLGPAIRRRPEAVGKVLKVNGVRGSKGGAGMWDPCCSPCVSEGNDEVRGGNPVPGDDEGGESLVTDVLGEMPEGGTR